MTKFKNILLIDDDEDYLYLVKRSLEKHNLFETVLTMTNGNDALNYITESCGTNAAFKCPDIIFVDNQMPGMNGATFLDKINNIVGMVKKSLLIYMVSAFASEKDMVMLKKYKIAGFINKPLTLEKMKALLVNVQHV